MRLLFVELFRCLFLELPWSFFVLLGLFVELLHECSFVELRSVLSSSCCRTFVELQSECSFVELLPECSFIELKGCSSSELLEFSFVKLQGCSYTSSFLPFSRSDWLLCSFRSQSLRRGYLRDITHENDLQEGFVSNNK